MKQEEMIRQANDMLFEALPREMSGTGPGESVFGLLECGFRFRTAASRRPSLDSRGEWPSCSSGGLNAFRP